MGVVDFPSLPQELIEEILVLCDPIDVAFVAQACKRLYEVVYGAFGGSFWRKLYLAQPLDDPRDCLSWLGIPRVDSSIGVNEDEEIDWKGELQKVIRARTVATRAGLCRGEEELQVVLKIFLDLARWVPPLSARENVQELSKNLLWVPAVLQGFLDIVEFGEDGLEESDGDSEVGRHVPPKTMWKEETVQLHAQLHTFYGLTKRDLLKRSRVQSRGFVYDIRNYNADNEYGPLRSDGRVDWVHLQAVHHVLSMHFVGATVGPLDGGHGQTEEGALIDDFEYAIFPMSMPFTQILVPKAEGGHERGSLEGIMPVEVVDEGAIPEGADWAFVTGHWSICFCFCDHRDLIAYNETAVEDEPLDTTLFEQDSFMEVFRQIDVKLQVTRVVNDPEHPGRPIIRFVGKMQAPSTSTMYGCVQLTPDNHVKWQFFSGDNGETIWSSLGIQIGGIGSSFGVLGSWTTVFHDHDDPVGPFWMQKVQ